MQIHTTRRPIPIRPPTRFLYFDPGRTKLVEDERFYDFTQLEDRQIAIWWCKHNQVQFFDHSIGNHDDLTIRRLLLRARAIGNGFLLPPKRNWIPVPWNKSGLMLPALTD